MHVYVEEGDLILDGEVHKPHCIHTGWILRYQGKKFNLAKLIAQVYHKDWISKHVIHLNNNQHDVNPDNLRLDKKKYIYSLPNMYSSFPGSFPLEKWYLFVDEEQYRIRPDEDKRHYIPTFKEYNKISDDTYISSYGRLKIGKRIICPFDHGHDFVFDLGVFKFDEIRHKMIINNVLECNTGVYEFSND